MKATHIADEKALSQALEAFVQQVVPQCSGDVIRTNIRLRLALDENGKVVKIDIIKADDKALAACWQQKFQGWTSGTALSNGHSGSVEFTLLGSDHD